MKVVIFCGGLGVRMGEATQRIPKPMIPIGTRPILWHIMRYYASWGHTDFILCLATRATSSRSTSSTTTRRSRTTSCCRTADTTFELLGSDIDEWQITFVDTGLHATIGERLKAVAPHLDDDESSSRPTATASPTLRSPTMIDRLARARQDRPVPLRAPDAQATTSSTGRRRRRHAIEAHEQLRRADQRRLLRLPPRASSTRSSPGRARGGAVRAADRRGELLAYRYDGFWGPMDTIKDKQRLERSPRAAPRALAAHGRAARPSTLMLELSLG